MFSPSQSLIALASSFVSVSVLKHTNTPAPGLRFTAQASQAMRVKNLPSSSSAGEQLVSDSSSKAKRPIPNRKDYPGSRQQKARYHYVDEMCGLIELAPVDTSEMTADVFGQLLPSHP